MDAQTPASISIEQKNEIADLYERCRDREFNLRK